MPNWSYTTLVVSGKSEDIKRFKEFAQTQENDEINVLDTEKFIPYPQKFKDMDKDDPNKSFNTKKEDELVDGLDGYSWCCKFWGTKWGICSPSIVDETTTTITYSYETAWSPASPVVKKMSEMFKELTFESSFDEESYAYEGDFNCENGEVTFEETRESYPPCEECEAKNDTCEYIEEKEQTLCKECQMTPLQKIIKKKLDENDNI